MLLNGNDLRGLRKAMRLRQGEIAQFLGVGNETVCRWEKSGAQLRSAYSEAIEKLVHDPAAIETIKLGRRQRIVQDRSKRFRTSTRTSR